MDSNSVSQALKWVAIVLGVIVLLIVGGVGGCGVYKGWQRGQRQADARNRVAITKIEIQNQNQQARVVAAQNGIVSAQAHQRYLQSVGIKAAQVEISKTLTDRYLQWEALQAEMKIAESGQNNTIIYVPSGNLGVPLVQTPPLKSNAPGLK